jgi:single-strand DNA-binding protein
MLRVSLLGNMGGDPEVRWSAKGTQITSIRVAVNQVRTGPDGERQENTEWFRAKIAGPRGEYISRLSKGTRVLVIGRLDIQHFQGKDGEPRVGFDVWADEITAISRPLGMEPDAAESESEAPEPAVAGVSSLGSGGATAARSGTNGRGSRATPRPAEAKPAEDLEDLPF